jgi:SAM-dependent methyltransferase
MATEPPRETNRAKEVTALAVDQLCQTREDRGDSGARAPFDALPDDTDQPWCHRPSEVDMDEPSVSRVYDAYLGGAANNRADREFAQRIGEILPNVHELAIANRRFLARGVQYALRHGVDQVIDIGAGVPSVWHTHHIAHALNPACRVIYVDHEAVAYEALRAASSGDDRLAVVRADLRDIEAVLYDPVTSRLIDYSRPVVLVMGLLLHFVPDTDDPAGLLTRYRQAVAPGSYVVISHDTADGREADMAQLAALYAEMGRPVVLRNRGDLAALLDGFELVEPGIVHMPRWHPADEDPLIDPPETSCVYAAVAKT